MKSFFGAITFYTIIPLPSNWDLDFSKIARWAPLVGVLLGAFLGLVDLGLFYLGFPLLTRSILIICLWLALTGGLHLDGVIDAADGLAVGKGEKALMVMKDSLTGAFGVMAGVVLVLLKAAALSDLEVYRWFAIITGAGWGRWGQVLAIACYPYLRETGKGSFHKESLQVPGDVILGLVLLLSVHFLGFLRDQAHWWLWLGMALIGLGSAITTGMWFNRRLGGHTGDTYGAVVEWTEAIYLCLLTAIMAKVLNE